MLDTTPVINWTRYSAESNPMISSRMPAIGKGVEEIRVTEDSGAYRVIYFARRAEAVYVLHAFQKKSQATSARDIGTAKKRLAQIPGGLK